MARAALGWSIVTTAKIAGIGKNTLLRFENGENSTTDTVRRLEAAYSAAGVTFPDTTTVRHVRPKKG